MTDKQMIVDGVDVSECERNGGKLCSMSRESYCYCSDRPNCIYKRFKRKEQENEELKQRLHQCWTVENSFVEQLDQLEAENKKLKQALVEIKEIAEIKQEQSVFVGETVFEQILQKISEVKK